MARSEGRAGPVVTEWRRDDENDGLTTRERRERSGHTCGARWSCGAPQTGGSRSYKTDVFPSRRVVLQMGFQIFPLTTRDEFSHYGLVITSVIYERASKYLWGSGGASEQVNVTLHVSGSETTGIHDEGVRVRREELFNES